MGWHGWETEIYPGMFLRKMYCVHCGTRLKTKKVTITHKKGDPDWKEHKHYSQLGILTIGMTSKSDISYVYKCPNCGRETTYHEQLEIRKRQKMFNRKIIPQNNDEIQVDCKEPKS